jgi:hypothetical protein
MSDQSKEDDTTVMDVMMSEPTPTDIDTKTDCPPLPNIITSQSALSELTNLIIESERQYQMLARRLYGMSPIDENIFPILEETPNVVITPVDDNVIMFPESLWRDDEGMARFDTPPIEEENTPIKINSQPF